MSLIVILAAALQMVIVILAAALLMPASAELAVRSLTMLKASARRATAPSPRRRTLGKLAAQDPVTLATAVAERYWRPLPCGGQITVLADMPLPAGLEPSDRRLGHVQLLARRQRPASAGQHLHAMHDLTRPLAVADTRARWKTTGTCSA